MGGRTHEMLASTKENAEVEQDYTWLTLRDRPVKRESFQTTKWIGCQDLFRVSNRVVIYYFNRIIFGFDTLDRTSYWVSQVILLPWVIRRK